MEGTPKPTQLACNFCAAGGKPDLRRIMKCGVRDENPFEAACARSPELSRGAGPYLHMVEGIPGKDDVPAGTGSHLSKRMGPDGKEWTPR